MRVTFPAFEYLTIHEKQIAPNSSLTLGVSDVTPPHAGFGLQWSADTAKDPEGRAKLAIARADFRIADAY